MRHDERDREIPMERNIRDDEERRMTLSEEELAVGKRRHLAGEVEVEKQVETRHVREQVPLSHDEVTIERHPVEPGMRAAGRIGEEDIRVPLEREEAMVEKRVVPKEEVLVRKRQVQDEEVVEADLRRERVEVEEDTRLRKRERGSR